MITLHRSPSSDAPEITVQISDHAIMADLRSALIAFALACSYPEQVIREALNVEPEDDLWSE